MDEKITALLTAILQQLEAINAREDRRDELAKQAKIEWEARQIKESEEVKAFYRQIIAEQTEALDKRREEQRLREALDIITPQHKQ